MVIAFDKKAAELGLAVSFISPIFGGGDTHVDFVCMNGDGVVIRNKYGKLETWNSQHLCMRNPQGANT